MTNQQNIENNSPSERTYAFADLPKDIQDKLLRMQNTDGDFLRTGEKRSVLVNIIGLLFMLFVFQGFLSTIDFSALDSVKILVFVAFSLPFIYWIAYFGRLIYRMFALPVKDHVYLTRTQIVETKDGAVRFFDLKDVAKIRLDKVSNKTMSGGWDYILNFEFAGGYLIGCVFPRWWKEHYAEAECWLEKSNVWRDEAAEALRRGDSAFFDANDIVSKSATTNLPVFKKSSSFLFVSPRLMFKITLAVFLLGIVAYAVVKLRGL